MQRLPRSWLRSVGYTGKGHNSVGDASKDDPVVTTDRVHDQLGHVPDVMRRFSARETTSSYKAAVSRVLTVASLVVIAGSVRCKSRQL